MNIIHKGGVNLRKFGRLREKYSEVYGTQQEFATALGMDKATLNSKLNSKTEFTRSEIEKTCVLLGISVENIPEYFFY